MVFNTIKIFCSDGIQIEYVKCDVGPIQYVLRYMIAVCAFYQAVLWILICIPEVEKEQANTDNGDKEDEAENTPLNQVSAEDNNAYQ